MADSTDDLPSVSPARLVYDGLWKYRGYHDCASICHLRLFAPAESGEPFIAIFTEMDSNTGTSVTNRIEHLATMAWQWLERPERGLTVIEHYPNRGMHNPIRDRWQFPEEFDVVTFDRFDGKTFARPKWRRVSRKVVEDSIRQLFQAVENTEKPRN